MINFLDLIYYFSFIVLFISFIGLFINFIRVFGIGRLELNEDSIEKLTIIFESRYNQFYILFIFISIITLTLSSFYIKDILKNRVKLIYNSKNFSISKQDLKTLDSLNINLNELKYSTELGRNESNEEIIIKISNKKEILDIRLVGIRDQRHKYNLYIDNFKFSTSTPIASVYKK